MYMDMSLTIPSGKVDLKLRLFKTQAQIEKEMAGFSDAEVKKEAQEALSAIVNWAATLEALTKEIERRQAVKNN